MNREDVICMAHESHLDVYGLGTDYAKFADALERFAALVTSAERERIKQANAPEIERVNSYIKKLEDAVAAEREACIKIVEDEASQYASPVWAFEIVNDIKAREQNNG